MNPTPLPHFFLGSFANLQQGAHKINRKFATISPKEKENNWNEE